MDDLANIPILALYEEGDHWELVDGNGAARSVPIKPRLRCSDFFVLSQAAQDGLGVALLPEHLCRHKLEASTLLRVLPEWKSGEGIIHVMFASRRGQRSSVRALIDFLVAEFAREDR